MKCDIFLDPWISCSNRSYLSSCSRRSVMTTLTGDIVSGLSKMDLERSADLKIYDNANIAASLHLN